MNNTEEIAMNNADNIVNDVNVNDVNMTPGPTPIELKGEDVKSENFAQEMTEAMYNVRSTVNAALMDVDPSEETTEDATEDATEDTAITTTADTATTTTTTTTVDTATANLSPHVIKEQLKYCQRILKGLKRHREAGPFLLPVDPVALNIPDYLTVIKQPMDLSTISKKLDLNEYASAEAFMAEVRLMLNNCFTYNAPDSQVTKMGRNLEKYFNTSMAKMSSEIAGASNASTSGSASVNASVSAIESPSASRPKRDSVSVGVSGGNVIRRASSPSGSLTFCSSVLRELMKKTNAHLNWPFMMPVDPVALNIPDYFEVVKQPMDLGTIRKKLDTGTYARADQFEADVRLVFSNCYAYNPVDSDVSRMARDLEALFDLKMSQKPAPKAQTTTSASSSAASSSASLPSSHTHHTSHTHHNNHTHHTSQFIPSSASQLIPGLDALEDESEKILAINHQIQILQSELNHLLLNRKSSSSASMRSDSGVSIGSMNKQQAASKPAKKKNVSSALSAVNKAPAFASNEDMSFDEKRQLSEDVSNLPQENMMRVLEIIQECMPNLHSNGDSDVIELDIEALDLRTLRALQSYIWACLNPGKKRKTVGNGGNKPATEAVQKKSKHEEHQSQSVATNNGSYDSSSSSSSEDDD